MVTDKDLSELFDDWTYSLLKLVSQKNKELEAGVDLLQLMKIAAATGDYMSNALLHRTPTPANNLSEPHPLVITPIDPENDTLEQNAKKTPPLLPVRDASSSNKRELQPKIVMRPDK